MKRREFISVRLSERERAQLDKLAKIWGTPRSDIVRWGLRAVLAGGKPNIAKKLEKVSK